MQHPLKLLVNFYQQVFRLLDFDNALGGVLLDRIDNQFRKWCCLIGDIRDRSRIHNNIKLFFIIFIPQCLLEPIYPVVESLILIEKEVQIRPIQVISCWSLCHNILICIVYLSNQNIEEEDRVDQAVEEPEDPDCVGVVLNGIRSHACCFVELIFPFRCLV